MNTKFSLEYLSQFSVFINGILERYIDFIDAFKYICNDREKISQNYSLDGFNIFTSIADGYYWKELFHSHVLGLILDPATPEMGDIQYLTKFCQILGEKNKNIVGYVFSNTVKVEKESGDESKKERGNIDIFIYDETHCIIIENKLNNAIDQPDQLARYLRIARNKGKEVYAIVYIPLYYKYPLFNYSNEYKSDIAEIKEKLVILPAIELAENYLDICTGIDTDGSGKETARVYINHYSKLIKDLGGKSMTEDVDKAFIKKIFSNRENIVAAKNIAEVWIRRADLLGKILRESIQTDLHLEYYEEEKAIGKSVNCDISLVLWFTPEGEIDIGVIPGKDKFNKKLQEQLTNILNETKSPGKYFSEVESNESLIYQVFEVDEFEGSIEEMENLLKERYRFLERNIVAVKKEA